VRLGPIDENPELTVAIAQAIIVSQAVASDHRAIRAIPHMNAGYVPRRCRRYKTHVIATDVKTGPVAVRGPKMAGDEVGPIEMHAAVGGEKWPGSPAKGRKRDRLLAGAARGDRERAGPRTFTPEQEPVTRL
jgi:hypothetical protein